MSVAHITENADDSFKPASDADAYVATVIKFGTSWCSPCKYIAPYFDKLAVKFPNLRFLSLELDTYRSANPEDTDYGEKYNVNAVPTFVALHRNGSVVQHLEGADQNQLKKMCKQISEHYSQPL